MLEVFEWKHLGSILEANGLKSEVYGSILEVYGSISEVSLEIHHMKYLGCISEVFNGSM